MPVGIFPRPAGENCCYLANSLHTWVNFFLEEQCYYFPQLRMQVQIRDHPFKTSAFFRVGGVKNLQNLRKDSSKKLPTVGGRGQKL